MDQNIVDRITARKKQGFITHLKAAGHSDQYVKIMLDKYASQDARRTQNLVDLREAILVK